VKSLVRFNEICISNPTVREKGSRFCGSINKVNADKSFYQFQFLFEDYISDFWVVAIVVTILWTIENNAFFEI